MIDKALCHMSPRERLNRVIGRVEVAILAKDILDVGPNDEEALADVRTTYELACKDLITDLDELSKIGVLDEFRRYLAVTYGRP